MSRYVPSEVFFTKGVGRSKEKLQSFEEALRNAGIACYNLVRVSSILPPHCKVVGKKAGLKKLKPGQIVFCVLADLATNEPNRLIATSVGVAIPSDRSKFGYLSEHHTFGMTDSNAGDYAEDLAAMMLASTLGIQFDEDVHWDDRKEIWKMENQIVKTTNTTQSAIGSKKGLWTTVVAAAVFVMDSN